MDAGGGAASPLRPRFYGRRCGRGLRSGRQALVSQRLPELAVRLPGPDEALDPERLFPERRPEVWLEIGCGTGEHLSARALSCPDVAFIACEPYVNGVAALLARIRDNGLENRVRVHADDARPLLAQLTSGCIDRVFLLFPDPWPKRRHHRRRFVQPETVRHIARILKPDGEFLFASDHTGYVRWTLAFITADPTFEWCAQDADDWRLQPGDWVGTRYEKKALARGAPCVYLRFRRLGSELYG